MPDYGEPIELVDDARCHDLYIGDRDGKCVAIVQHFSDERVKRAIACYNACAGIRDPEKVVPLMKHLIKESHGTIEGLCQYIIDDDWCRPTLKKLEEAINALEAKDEA